MSELNIPKAFRSVIRSISTSVSSPSVQSKPALKVDTFTAASTSQQSGPPPLAGRTEQTWQSYVEQFRGAAEAQLKWKRQQLYPDPAVQRLIHGGGGPTYVGHWSTAPGKENTPVFFQYFPNDKAPQAQLYTFPRNGEWASFEVANDFFKAYDDKTFTAGNQGTSSVLGFPNSGSEFVDGKAQWPFFVGDPEVKSRIAADGKVNFQAFERGYLVNLGGGKVQAFDLDGRRIGSAYPGGSMGAPTSTPVTKTPGTNAQGVFAPVFQSYQVAPNLSVPSRVGVHWGPLTNYSNVERINAVADQLKSHGVGFATVIVDARDVNAQAASIKALLDRGIQPVIRLLPSGEYNKTMNQLSDGELQQMATATKQLQDMGVKAIQLDNEPNIDEGGKQIVALLNSTTPPGQSPAYKAEMKKYVDNTARAMELINQRAPGMSIGFAGFSPGQNGWKEMYTDLMNGMRDKNAASGGALLKNAFVSVHPYTTGQDGQGVGRADWERNTARQILGIDINTLATEGGNPVTQAGQQDRSSEINVDEVRAMGRDPNATQCFWIVSDYYLRGETGNPVGWEWSALIDPNGNGTKFWNELGDIAQGRKVN